MKKLLLIALALGLLSGACFASDAGGSVVWIYSSGELLKGPTEATAVVIYSDADGSTLTLYKRRLTNRLIPGAYTDTQALPTLRCPAGKTVYEFDLPFQLADDEALYGAASWTGSGTNNPWWGIIPRRR